MTRLTSLCSSPEGITAWRFTPSISPSIPEFPGKGLVMLQSQSVRQPKQIRRGFTLLELLVTVSIIALLISLVLPAIQNSRMAARRLQCQNNVKNISLALAGYLAEKDGHFPAVFGNRNGRTSVWTTEILPHIDAKGVYDNLENAPAPDIRIPAFICPDDDQNEELKRGLSYVVNVGFGRMTTRCPGPPIHEDTISVSSPTVSTASRMVTNGRTDGLDGYKIGLTVISVSIGPPDLHIGIDWDGSGQISKHEELATTATGVFWSGHDLTNKSFNVSRMDTGDGTSNTLMISERNRKRDWAVPPLQSSVDLTQVLRLRYLAPMTSHGFGISTAAFRDAIGMHVMPKEGAWTASPVNQHLQYTMLDTGGRFDCPNYVQNATDGIINQPGSYHAPPMSDHIGGVNVAFCDGSVVFMSEELDPQVYTLLLTSAGSRNGQRLLSGDEF